MGRGRGALSPDPSRRVWHGPTETVSSQGITTYDRRELAQKVPFPSCVIAEGTGNGRQAYELAAARDDRQRRQWARWADQHRGRRVDLVKRALPASPGANPVED